MKINIENVELGNRAMAQVLLLFYHLLREGGITHDQTVYLDLEQFDPFKFLDVQVENQGTKLDIDETLLRDGAFITMIIHLDDMVCEFEDDFLAHKFTRKILDKLRANKKSLPKEGDSILKLYETPESQFNYPEFQIIKQQLFEFHVVHRVGRWLAGKK